jgi:hypothetical protein
VYVTAAVNTQVISMCIVIQKIAQFKIVHGYTATCAAALLAYRGSATKDGVKLSNYIKIQALNPMLQA